MRQFSLGMIFLVALGTTTIVRADDEKGEKKDESNISKKVIISGVKVVNDDDEEGGEDSKLSGNITIKINGEEHEFKFGNQDGKVVQEIHEVIKDGDREASLRAKFFGHGMIIGPDGETKAFKLGDLAENKEALEKLPDEVRKRLEKAMKESSKGAIFGRGIMIGPDGAKKEFKLGEGMHFGDALKHLPEEARKKVEQAMKGAEGISIQSIGSGGRAIVISPDGAKKEFKFGDGNTDIDVEVLEHLPKNLQLRIQRSKKTSSSSESDPLSDKLDLILERLERIEKDVQALKDSQ